MTDFKDIMRALGITVAVSSTRGSEVVTVWALCAGDTPAVRRFIDRSNF